MKNHMFELSRLPHFVDNWPTDGGEVSLYPPPQEDCWHSFLLQAESIPGPQIQLGGLRKLKKSNDLIGNQTCNLPACNIMPHPTLWLSKIVLLPTKNRDVPQTGTTFS
jgi:hypothetical protein